MIELNGKRKNIICVNFFYNKNIKFIKKKQF